MSRGTRRVLRRVPRLVFRLTVVGVLLALTVSVGVRAGAPPAGAAASRAPSVSWDALAPGLETASIPWDSGDAYPLVIVRVDPARWELELLCRDALGLSSGLTAREWCERYNLTAAINAGMFGEDYVTHVGFLRAGDHTNNPRKNAYRSVAVFGPRDPDRAPFRIHDLDDPTVDWERLVAGYDHVVQNLRLIKRPGRNRWSKQDRRWSEAALGEDDRGRALLIMSRTPQSMRDLNDRLVSLGIGVVCAQHLEGGPEAQLYVAAGGRSYQGFGSYETGFREDDGNRRAWPIPNVIGVRPRGTGREGGAGEGRTPS